MPKKSMRDKVAEYMRRKAEKLEQEQAEHNKDYQPERDGYLPDRK